VDLTELPPAKGKILRPEGSVLLVHAQDFMQQKQLISDIPAWVQYFSNYSAIVWSKNPDCQADLLWYISQIMRVSQCFK